MTDQSSLASSEALADAHAPREFGAEPKDKNDHDHDSHEHEKAEQESAEPPRIIPLKEQAVPFKKRRGLLSSLTLIPEVSDARNYPPLIKHCIVGVVACAGISGPMGTSIILPAVNDITANLHTLEGTVNVSVGIYLISMGIFPMWWSNFSERHGRRSVYVVSFCLYFAFSIGCALAPTIGSLIGLRFLTGMGASAVQACGAATVSDLYIQQERGTALGLFYLGPLLGPFMSPIIGGAVAEAWGWRATMWVMVIVCGLNVMLVLFLLPETLRAEDSLSKVKERLQRLQDPGTVPDETAVDPIMPTILRLTTNQLAYLRRVQEYEVEQELAKSQPQKQTRWQVAYDYVVRPMHALVFLLYPPVALAICYLAICFTAIYFFNITITSEYSLDPYNYSSVIVGLMYIPNLMGYIAASIVGGRWNDWLIRRYAKRHDGELRPELRILWNIVIAACLYPPACMIFGWCIHYGKFWLTPLIGTALFGFASMLVIGVTVTYLVDVLPGKGATGVAMNNLVRQILAAVATFITLPLLHALGAGVLFSIIAGIITVAGLTQWVLKKKGHLLRERYDITDYYAKL